MVLQSSKGSPAAPNRLFFGKKIQISLSPFPPFLPLILFYVADFFTKISIWNSKAGIDWWRMLSCKKKKQ